MNYRNAVEILASSKDKMRFDNKGQEHAASVIEMMFKYYDEVRMYSGNMNADVTDNQYFMQALNHFLNNNKKLYIFLDDIPNEENQSNALKKILSFENQDNVIVKRASQDFIDELRTIFNGEVYHFAVADDKAYRVEFDAENYKASCSYNKPEKAQILKSIFDNNFF